MNALSLDILKTAAHTLPRLPGIYEFWGPDGDLLYVGKSVNIRARVLSHLATPSLNGRNVDIRREIDAITFQETAGELGALLLEAWKIKKNTPLYNKRSRKTKLLAVVLRAYTKEGILTVDIKHLPAESPEESVGALGIFRSVRQAKEYLLRLQKEHELCPKMMGFEKGNGACFYHSLQKCRGVCAGHESVEAYNARFEQAFEATRIAEWPFEHEILLKEERSGKTESFSIHKWCLQEAWQDEGDKRVPFFGEEVESFFDYDVYKILYPFIARGLDEKFS